MAWNVPEPLIAGVSLVTAVPENAAQNLALVAPVPAWKVSAMVPCPAGLLSA